MTKTPKILAVLRRLAERRVPLGALCTGGYALAKAGLLDKYRATIHWENLSALREEFPRIHLSDQLAAPSAQYPFGTDEVGRDVLSRVLFSARPALGAGLVTVALAARRGFSL